MKTQFTPGPWDRGLYDDTGGYDCMTGGIKVGPAKLDGITYGQEHCAPISPEQLATMEADALLIAAAPDGYNAAELAYLVMLQMPHDALRIKSQVVLCALRDFLAAATGRESEDVQDEYEARALGLPYSWS